MYKAAEELDFERANKPVRLIEDPPRSGDAKHQKRDKIGKMKRDFAEV